MPGVVAVVTGELLAQHKLAWMPTLSGDTQAVLATDKVRFQGQEVACVIAETKYIAEDAAALVERRLRAAPGGHDARSRRSPPGAVVIRDEKEGQTDNQIYHWEAGDKDATDAAFARAAKVVSLETFYPRCHPSPLETCGIVADLNPVTGNATIYMTSQAPHAHRTLFAIVAGLPEQKIRIISPDLGGGFGNKVPIYPGYVVATAASLLIGRPVKWIEDRTENLISTGFARDYHMDGSVAIDENGKFIGLRVNLLSDNGAFFADAQPTQVQGRALPHRHRLLRHPRRAHRRGRRVHQQGARRRRVPVLVPGDRGLVPHRAARGERGRRAGQDPVETRLKNFIQPEAFPYQSATGFEYDSGDYPARDAGRARHARLRRAAQGAGREAGQGRADGHRRRQLHRGGRRRQGQGLRHRRAADVRLRGAARASDRQGDPQARREVAGPGPRDDLRADRGRGARHPRIRHRGA